MRYRNNCFIQIRMNQVKHHELHEQTLNQPGAGPLHDHHLPHQEEGGGHDD